jgi:hypothetical protein
LTVIRTHESLSAFSSAPVHSTHNSSGDLCISDNGIRIRDLRSAGGGLCRDKPTTSHYHCGERTELSSSGVL